MLETCSIVIFPINEGRFTDDSINCMVDAAPPLGTRNTQHLDNPPTDILFACDHHDSAKVIVDACKESGVKPPKIPVLGKRIGSTSSMIAFLALCLKVMDKISPEAKAAIMLGIYDR